MARKKAEPQKKVQAGSTEVAIVAPEPPDDNDPPLTAEEQAFREWEQAPEPNKNYVKTMTDMNAEAWRKSNSRFWFNLCKIEQKYRAVDDENDLQWDMATDEIYMPDGMTEKAAEKKVLKAMPDFGSCILSCADPEDSPARTKEDRSMLAKRQCLNKFFNDQYQLNPKRILASIMPPPQMRAIQAGPSTQQVEHRVVHRTTIEGPAEEVKKVLELYHRGMGLRDAIDGPEVQLQIKADETKKLLPWTPRPICGEPPASRTRSQSRLSIERKDDRDSHDPLDTTPKRRSLPAGRATPLRSTAKTTDVRSPARVRKSASPMAQTPETNTRKSVGRPRSQPAKKSTPAAVKPRPATPPTSAKETAPMIKSRLPTPYYPRRSSVGTPGIGVGTPGMGTRSRSMLAIEYPASSSTDKPAAVVSSSKTQPRRSYKKKSLGEQPKLGQSAAEAPQPTAGTTKSQLPKDRRKSAPKKLDVNTAVALANPSPNVSSTLEPAMKRRRTYDVSYGSGLDVAVSPHASCFNNMGGGDGVGDWVSSQMVATEEGDFVREHGSENFERVYSQMYRKVQRQYYLKQ
ncbi:unnamed protein product, partial [Mesorhabditis spiculigera]